MTDLGTLGGAGVQSQAWGINDRGQVVGTSIAPVGQFQQFRGFVWRDGRMTNLGVAFAGGINGSQATDINDNGLIVGTSDVAADATHAVLWRR
jgi:probable HAF family extracellular repeat protein